MTEIERKFRVEHLPNGRSEPVRFEQAYIALDGNVEVRVRRHNATCSLAVKGGSGLERSEVEPPLDHDDVETLWALAEGGAIDYRRSTIKIGEHTAEIDEYDPRRRRTVAGFSDAVRDVKRPAGEGENAAGRRGRALSPTGCGNHSHNGRVQPRFVVAVAAAAAVGAMVAVAVLPNKALS